MKTGIALRVWLLFVIAAFGIDSFAQNFAPPTRNPFGLDNQFMFHNVSEFREYADISDLDYGDLDNDGDLDIMATIKNQNALEADRLGFMVYFENRGSAAAPIYNSAIIDPFNMQKGSSFGAVLQQSEKYIQLVDYDGDNDLDIHVSGPFTGTGSFFILRNFGTNSFPFFPGPLLNEDSLGLLLSSEMVCSKLVDLDADSDFDILAAYQQGGDSVVMVYFQNTGTLGNPVYASALPNPFGLQPTRSTWLLDDLEVEDWDGDNDLDIRLNGGFNSPSEFYYFENTGDSVNASFAAADTTNWRTGNPWYKSGGNWRHRASFGDLNNDGDLDHIGIADDTLSGWGERLYYNQNVGSPSSWSYNNNVVLDPFGFVYYSQTNLLNVFPHFVDIDADGDLDFFGESSWTFNSSFPDVDRSGLVFARNTGSATTPVFANLERNPFGLDSLHTQAGILQNAGSFGGVNFADMDADGDYDLIAAMTGPAFNEARLMVFENTGTAGNPQFNADYFDALVDTFLFNTVVGDGPDLRVIDLDGDNDFDILGMGSINTPACDFQGLLVIEGVEFFYLENTGDSTSPDFAAAVSQPFGYSIHCQGEQNQATFDIFDIDKDNDLDIMACGWLSDTTSQVTSPLDYRPFQFHLNSGGPGFANIDFSDTAVHGLYGIMDTMYNTKPEFVDIDGDGDMDFFTGNSMENTVWFYENLDTTFVTNTPPSINQAAPIAACDTSNAINFQLAGIDANDSGQFCAISATSLDTAVCKVISTIYSPPSQNGNIFISFEDTGATQIMVIVDDQQPVNNLDTMFIQVTVSNCSLNIPPSFGTPVPAVNICDTFSNASIPVSGFSLGNYADPVRIEVISGNSAVFNVDSIAYDYPDTFGTVFLGIVDSGNTQASIRLIDSTNGSVLAQTVSTVNVLHCPAPVVSINDPRLLRELTIYPNPFDDRILIHAKGQGPYWYVLSDLQGRTLMEDFMERESTVLEAGDLPAGTYLLTVVDAEGRQASWTVQKK